MNVREKPFEEYKDKWGHKSAPIWDYEEKVDREKERWRKLAKETREKCNEGIRRKYREEIGFANAKAAEMRKKGGDEARKKIAARKVALTKLAEECGCKTVVQTTWDKQDKAMAYFKKLKATRDKMREERGRPF